MTVHLNTSIQSITRHNGQITVTFTEEGETKTVTAEEGMNALGRSPNTASLNLEGVGVELLSSGHIQTNGYQQTTQSHIYAAGDCTGPLEVVHLAVQQGETAAKHFLQQTVSPMNYDLALMGVFTDPQIAWVGLTSTQLKERNQPFIDSSYPFNDHGKSLLMEATHGYVRILASPDNGRILGAEVVGPEACELIHAMTFPVTIQATVNDVLRAPWYHPTLSEIWTYPLEEIQEQLE